MKTIRVTAAVICNSPEKPTRIFATERGYGELRAVGNFPAEKLNRVKLLRLQ